MSFFWWISSSISSLRAAEVEVEEEQNESIESVTEYSGYPDDESERIDTVVSDIEYYVEDSHAPPVLSSSIDKWGSHQLNTHGISSILISSFSGSDVRRDTSESFKSTISNDIIATSQSLSELNKIHDTKKERRNKVAETKRDKWSPGRLPDIKETKDSPVRPAPSKTVSKSTLRWSPTISSPEAQNEDTRTSSKSILKDRTHGLSTESEVSGLITSLALDGGYGWFIVLGCFLAHFIIGGLSKADGIFLVEFRSEFGLTFSLAAWPGTLSAVFKNVIGPVASGICIHYSERTSTMLGAIIISTGVFLTGYAQDVYFLFFSEGLLMGVGAGLIMNPALIIVHKYFNKHLSLAVGLGTSGVGVGTVAIPLLTQEMFDTLSFQSSFHILTGITLALFVVAMLFRPVTWNHQLSSKDVYERSEIKFEIDVEVDLVTVKSYSEKKSAHSGPTNSVRKQNSRSTTTRALSKPTKSTISNNLSYSPPVGTSLKDRTIAQNVDQHKDESSRISEFHKKARMPMCCCVCLNNTCLMFCRKRQPITINSTTIPKHIGCGIPDEPTDLNEGQQTPEEKCMEFVQVNSKGQNWGGKQNSRMSFHYIKDTFQTTCSPKKHSAKELDMNKEDSFKIKESREKGRTPMCCICLNNTRQTQRPITVNTTTVHIQPKNSICGLADQLSDLSPEEKCMEYVQVNSRDKHWGGKQTTSMCFHYIKYIFDTCFPKERHVKSKNSHALFNYQLLCIPSFAMYCICNILFNFASKTSFTFIPAFTKGTGIGSGAVIIAITGVTDTFAKITVGYLLNTEAMRQYRTYSVVVFIFIMSGLAIAIPQVNEFYQMAVLAGMFGFFSGAYVAQKSVILADILGTDDITSSFGLLIFFQTFGVIVGVPVSAAINDVHGPHAAFYLGGGIMMAAGFCMIASIVAVNRQKHQASLYKRCSTILSSVQNKRNRSSFSIVDAPSPT